MVWVETGDVIKNACVHASMQRKCRRWKREAEGAISQMKDTLSSLSLSLFSYQRRNCYSDSDDCNGIYLREMHRSRPQSRLYRSNENSNASVSLSLAREVTSDVSGSAREHYGRYKRRICHGLCYCGDIWRSIRLSEG